MTTRGGKTGTTRYGYPLPDQTAVKLLLQISRRIVLYLLIIYFGLLTLLYFAQGRLIYPASKGTEATMLVQAAGEKLEAWRDRTGGIIGWWRRNPTAQKRIIVFHGNAGHALHRTHFIEALDGLNDGQTWEARLFEYPGYGARPGIPSEKILTSEALSAVEELLATDSRPLFIIGESLGSGVASAVASELQDKISGVALLIPYESLASAASFQYPYVPVRWLMHDRFDNAQALRKYHGRVAFVLAGKDEVVTFSGGERLYSHYSGPKFLRVFPEARHNDLDYSPGALWWRQISDFLTAPAVGSAK